MDFARLALGFGITSPAGDAAAVRYPKASSGAEKMVAFFSSFPSSEIN